MSETNIEGIGIIIDDKVFDNESGDSIEDIVKNLEELGIPLVKYDSIPAQRFYNSFSEVSFVLLDWRLLKSPHPSREQIKRQIDRNIKFIKAIKEFTFAPVFIFSSDDKVDIIDALKGAEVYDNEDYKNHIFVENKSELTDTSAMLAKISNWVESHPSVYLLKTWENAYSNSKNKLFWDLFNRSPEWPRILWENFESESVDESSGMIEILNLLIKSSTPIVNLDKDIICKFNDNEIEEDDIESVITGTMYLSDYPEDDLIPGDLFQDDDGLIVNIRPVCDTVIGRKKGDGTDAFDGYIYALRGKEIKKDDLNDRLLKKYGVIVERANEVIIYGMKPYEFIRFDMNNLEKISYDSIKEKRVARLLPPYVTHLQNRYAYYLSRVGFPSLPNFIFK